MKVETILAQEISSLPYEVRDRGPVTATPELVKQICGQHGWLGPRFVLEEFTSFVHHIVYGVVETQDNKIVAYSRPSKGYGEKKLQGLRSVGFGGHVTAFDIVVQSNERVNIGASIERSFLREMLEECTSVFNSLYLESSDLYLKDVDLEYFEEEGVESGLLPNQTVMLIHDTTDVGKVHLGFVVLVKSTLNADDLVKTLSENSEVLSPVTIDCVEMASNKEELSKFEPWSQNVIEYLAHR